ncbi:unnamed protein product [Prorocentrum cordatum]|uniref:Uncharacterized protein n=1 Tax=Prorocentrum cordatum TaxID=2364126 RepID=A0ABN9WN81_9DINO|nr:unnamed protein product [Polarella glacialis]
MSEAAETAGQTAAALSEAAETPMKCDKCAKTDCEKYTLVNKSLVETRNRRPIWRCSHCNNAGNHLATLKQSNPELFEGFAVMTREAKQEFMARCKGMALADVKKELSERITSTSHAEVGHEFSEEPEAMSVKEAAELPVFKHHPEGLQKLLDSPGMAFTCRHTGFEMVYVPKFKKKYREEVTRQTTHVQSARAEVGIPKAKAKPSATHPKVVSKVKAPPVRLKVKADGFIGEARQNADLLMRLVVKARTNEGKEYVTPAVATRAEGAAAAVVALCDALEPAVQENAFDKKEHVENSLQKLSDSMDVVTDHATKLAGLLEDIIPLTLESQAAPEESGANGGIDELLENAFAEGEAAASEKEAGSDVASGSASAAGGSDKKRRLSGKAVSEPTADEETDKAVHSGKGKGKGKNKTRKSK